MQLPQRLRMTAMSVSGVSLAPLVPAAGAEYPHTLRVGDNKVDKEARMSEL